MKRNPLPYFALALAMLACNLTPTAPPTQLSVEQALTMAVQTIEAQAPTASATPANTPTNTLTSTPGVPTVTVSTATNCRTGPGTIYDLVMTLQPGQPARVVGKYTPGNYWVITPGSGQCWLWGQYATVSGDLSGLPEMVPPPTPTPSLPLAPKDFKADISCHLVSSPLLHNAAHITLTWSDVATNEEGYRVYRDDVLLATLGANESSFEDDTTQQAIVLDSNIPLIKYGVEAFNGAGKSDRKEKNVSCFTAP